MKKSNLLGVADTGNEAGWDEDWNDVVGQGGRVLEKNDWKKQIHGKVDQVVVENRVVEGFVLGDLVLKSTVDWRTHSIQVLCIYRHNHVRPLLLKIKVSKIKLLIKLR